MKLGIILSRTEPETVFNALRLANYSLKQGDAVRIFLMGQRVELDKICDAKFDVQTQARAVLESGGRALKETADRVALWNRKPGAARSPTPPGPLTTPRLITSYDELGHYRNHPLAA